MNYEDVLSFVRENPACTVATIDGDQPRVRWFLSIFFEGDDSIYFTTTTAKNVGRQIGANPKTELCYLAPDASRMLRITTEFEDIDDRKKKEDIIERQSYLKDAKVGADDPAFMLLRVKNGKARFWSMADNLKEDGLEMIEF